MLVDTQTPVHSWDHISIKLTPPTLLTCTPNPNSLNSTMHTTYHAPSQFPIPHHINPGWNQIRLILFMLWKCPPGGSEKELLTVYVKRFSACSKMFQYSALNELPSLWTNCCLIDYSWPEKVSSSCGHQSSAEEIQCVKQDPCWWRSTQ